MAGHTDVVQGQVSGRIFEEDGLRVAEDSGVVYRRGLCTKGLVCCKVACAAIRTTVATLFGKTTQRCHKTHNLPHFADHCVAYRFKLVTVVPNQGKHL